MTKIDTASRNARENLSQVKLYSDQNVVQEYGAWLDQYDWDHFCTFTTRLPISVGSARRLMVKLGDTLGCPDRAEMFWAAEPFETREGHHLHALLSLHGDVDKYHLWQYWHSRYGRNSILNYDSGKKGSEYLAKYVTKGFADWDIYAKPLVGYRGPGSC